MRQLAQVLAFEQHLTLRDFAGGIDHAENREAGHRLARTGLAHQTQDFSRPQADLDVTDCRPGTLFGVEHRLQIFNF